MRRLEGQTCVVTGAGRGIGRGIVEKLHSEGARVVVTDLDGDSAELVAQGLNEAQNGSAIAVQADVSSMPSVEKLMQRVYDRFQQLDVLVNNAGWDKVEPFLQSVPTTWDKIMHVNLYGVLHCCRVAVPFMIEDGGGKVINIASDAGRVGSTGEAVYSAAKGGVVAFSKSLARETARSNVRVNCVCPGPADTPLFNELFADKPNLSEALIRAIPLRRLAQPEDVANVVCFLASGESDYMTGQTVSVSGGLTMC